MNYIQKLSSRKTIIRSITILVIMIAVTSCARKLRFNTSPVVPASEGTVKVKKDNNKNYNVKISLSNMAVTQKRTLAK